MKIHEQLGQSPVRRELDAATKKLALVALAVEVISQLDLESGVGVELDVVLQDDSRWTMAVHPVGAVRVEVGGAGECTESKSSPA